MANTAGARRSVRRADASSTCARRRARRLAAASRLSTASERQLRASGRRWPRAHLAPGQSAAASSRRRSSALVVEDFHLPPPRLGLRSRQSPALECRQPRCAARLSGDLERLDCARAFARHRLQKSRHRERWRAFRLLRAARRVRPPGVVAVCERRRGERARRRRRLLFRLDLSRIGFQVDPTYCVIYIAYYALAVVVLLLACFADRPKHHTRKVRAPKISFRDICDFQRAESPEFYASFPSALTFHWFGGLALRGYRRLLVLDELWALSECDRAAQLVAPFERNYALSVRGRCLSNLRAKNIAMNAALIWQNNAKSYLFSLDCSKISLNIRFTVHKIKVLTDQPGRVDISPSSARIPRRRFRRSKSRKNRRCRFSSIRRLSTCRRHQAKPMRSSHLVHRLFLAETAAGLSPEERGNSPSCKENGMKMDENESADLHRLCHRRRLHHPPLLALFLALL